MARVFDADGYGSMLRSGEFLGDTVDSYRSFLNRGMGIDMRWNHDALISTRGVIQYVGRWRRFHLVEPAGRCPAALLCLGEVEQTPEGLALVDQLTIRDAGPWVEPKVWGLSLGMLPGDGDQWHPFEISITREPADPGAMVLGTGREAIRTWSRLTGDEVRTGGPLAFLDGIR